MTTHEDHTIAAFLADGGYASAEEWMRDSDYLYVEDSFGDGSMVPGWVDLDDNRVEPEGAIEGAIEASGFKVKVDLRSRT